MYQLVHMYISINASTYWYMYPSVPMSIHTSMIMHVKMIMCE